MFKKTVYFVLFLAIGAVESWAAADAIPVFVYNRIPVGAPENEGPVRSFTADQLKGLKMTLEVRHESANPEGQTNDNPANWVFLKKEFSQETAGFYRDMNTGAPSFVIDAAGLSTLKMSASNLIVTATGEGIDLFRPYSTSFHMKDCKSIAIAFFRGLGGQLDAMLIPCVDADGKEPLEQFAKGTDPFKKMFLSIFEETQQE